jgi:hypothetical protein
MSGRSIAALSKCPFGKWFLLKSYSLELLFKLLDSDAEGLDELRKSMRSATPQLPAFLDFISLLEGKGCVERVSGTSKKSKRVLRLTAQARKSIESHLKKVQ